MMSQRPLYGLLFTVVIVVVSATIASAAPEQSSVQEQTTTEIPVNTESSPEGIQPTGQQSTSPESLPRPSDTQRVENNEPSDNIEGSGVVDSANEPAGDSATGDNKSATEGQGTAPTGDDQQPVTPDEEEKATKPDSVDYTR